MFSRFMPLALIRGSRHRRAVEAGRRTRASRRTRARFALEGLEDRCLLSSISGITEFPVPGTTFSPNGIAAGPDGNLWFTDGGHNAIGMINPTTHAVSEFAVPTASAYPYAIAAGPDGNLWFTEKGASKIGEINPTTHAITEFTIPTANAFPQAITSGPDGNIWFAEWFQHKLGELNPQTHAMSEFALSGCCVGPGGIAAGHDGSIWFNWPNAGEVGKINPATHALSYFQIPAGGSAQAGITAGPDGNLWFCDAYAGGQICMINPTTDVISFFHTSNSEPWGITAGPDGNLWFTAPAGQIARINPTTDAITEYPVPYANSSPCGIMAGPDGNLWFTDPGNNAIGVATLAASQLVVTQQPPASVTAGSPFGLTVQAEDNSGNVVSSFNGTVTVALANNPAGATLGGTVTVTASNGVATFSGLTLNKAASGYTLYVSASGLGAGVTSAITVTPAAATQLVITQQPPTTVKVNTGLGFQASIEDQYGNVVTTAANTVNVALANNPTGATLGGTLSVTASQGVATFSGLTINKVGSGYTLRVSSSGLSSAVTNAINVTKNGASSALAVTTTTSTPDPLLAPLVLDSPDLWDGLGLKKRARWA